MFAVKLARAVGLKIFLTSSKDKKLEEISPHFPEPLIQTINYSQNPNWHEEVLRLTEGASLDLVIEVGGASTLLKSLKCTRRRGTVSQAGYLGKQAFEDVRELLPTIIDRKVCLTCVPNFAAEVAARQHSYSSFRSATDKESKRHLCRLQDRSGRSLHSAVS